MFKSKFDEIFNKIILENNLIIENNEQVVSSQQAEEIVSLIKGIDDPTDKKAISNQLKEMYRYIKRNNLNTGKKFSQSDWHSSIQPAIEDIQNEKLQKHIKNRLRKFMKIEGEFFIQDNDDNEQSDDEDISLLSKDDFHEFQSTFNGKFGDALIKSAQHGGIKPNKKEKFEKALLGTVENKEISPDLANSFNEIAINDNLVKDKDQFKELLKKYHVTVKQPESKKAQKIESHFEDALAKVVTKVKQQSNNKNGDDTGSKKDDSKYDENLNGMSLEDAYKRIKKLQAENNWKKNQKELNALGVDLDDVDDYQDRYRELQAKIKKYHGNKAAEDHVKDGAKTSEQFLGKNTKKSNNNSYTISSNSDF